MRPPPPSQAFTLRGPGPAAILFLNEVVAAVADGDPDVSETAAQAAVEAVKSASGLTPFHRDQVFATAIDRLTAAGFRDLDPGYAETIPHADHARMVMLGAIRNLSQRPIAAVRPF